MRFLTPANLVDLAEAIPARYRALVFVGAYGGLRIGELAGLRQSGVDLLAGAGHRGRAPHRVQGQADRRPAQHARRPEEVTVRGAHPGQLHPGRCGHQTIPWPVGEGRGHPARD
jgi:integrase